jgi:hypothetical protein
MPELRSVFLDFSEGATIHWNSREANKLLETWHGFITTQGFSRSVDSL